MLLQKLCWLSTYKLELLQQYAREKRHYTKHAAAIGMKEECRKPDLRCEKLTLQPLMYDGGGGGGGGGGGEISVQSTINAQVK